MNAQADTEAQFLGELAPLLVSKHGKRPERRQVSKRWLASSVLVGVTSALLMGGSLFAALEGREQLTTPAQAYQRDDIASNAPEKAPKGNHPGLRLKLAEDTSNIMMVSTVSQQGDNNVIKVRPFMNVQASMALAPTPAEQYPAFNALAVFSESGKQEIIAKSSDFMYGADVEGEVTLNVTDFPYREAVGNSKPRQRSAEIEQQIRAIAHNLDGGGSYVSAISFFDSERFSQTDQLLLSSADITVTPENVSLLSRYSGAAYPGVSYQERDIKVLADNTIAGVLQLEDISEEEAFAIENILSTDLGSADVKAGDRLHSWLQHSPNSEGVHKQVAKISVYRGPTHLVSIARTDDDRFVYAKAPDDDEALAAAAAQQPVLPTKNLPTVYDAIYRTALSEGLTQDLASSLIKIFAFDVDFRTRIKPQDQLEIFVSLEEGQEKPNAESEILYAAITTGKVTRRYYRFRDAETGRVDFYDDTGKSAKKFLLRQPVPNGRFRSPFGMRRHPISRVFKLHGGVDWSAPRGTPILAAGNGVVTQAKWAGGYGRQTLIQHANGYETSYSHQTAYAKGIRPGTRVRQGQVIGYVGSTGYSTGPHLHYEVKVNGKRVDPMRIRLPKGKILRGEELAAFEAERDRINALVTGEEEIEVASN